ncbi:hypothetical protein ACSFA7_14075 [Variovorax sp. LT1R20]|uniref:hypothetical protein n=1 Tax=Variovorax sp. LT1R20 TaxID=3443729 RepID=UPI003F462C56
MSPTGRRNWKRVRATSLRHALELCKDHAREKLNRSVEGIASEMGVADHWTVYKWLQTGRIPAILIRPFETACGIDFVTRWLAASSGRMLVDIPSGRALKDTDLVELHTGFSQALKFITDFYAGNADPEATVAALTTHLENVAWHRANVTQHSSPELDFDSE